MTQKAIALSMAVSVVFCGLSNQAAHSEDYFSGKSVRLVVGSAPGGSYDAYARLMARHLGQYLPGQPAVIVSNMPGASGAQSASFLYSTAPKDGLTVATFDSAIPFYQMMGQLGARYKSEEMEWIGSLSQTVNVVTVWHQSGIRTLDDAKKRDVIMGALSAGGINSVFPLVLNSIAGTRFKIVTGYSGSKAIDYAMETGEVQGRGSSAWVSWKALRPDWVRDKKILPLVQVGVAKDPDLPDVPLMRDLANTVEERALVDFIGAAVSIEHPLAGPPGMPREILAAYRKAFAAMEASPDFIADAEKNKLDLEPRSGEDVARIVKSIVATSPAVIEKVQTIMKNR